MTKYLVFLLQILLCTSQPIWAQSSIWPGYTDTKILNHNNIQITFDNFGTLATRLQYLPHDSVSAYWGQDGSQITDYSNIIVYEQGLFFICKINDEIHLSEAKWGSQYSPGPIIDGKAAMQINRDDSLRYRCYRIDKQSSALNNIDYKEWPFDFGAPLDKNNNPLLIADQTIWTVYNAMDSTAIFPYSSYKRYKPFPLEVRQISYVFESDNSISGYLNDIVFVEWTLINKSENTFDSAYVALWTDIDFTAENNYPAIDTTNQLGFCWSDTGEYNTEVPPAVGYTLIRGPIVEAPGEQASFKGRILDNFMNLPVTSFWGFHDDSYRDTSFYGPSYSINTSWNIARGFDKDGKEIIDPTTEKPTKFRYGGNPDTNEGWLANGKSTSGGAGFYMFSGPFYMNPGDSQWVLIALIAAESNNKSSSIMELKEKASFARSIDYNRLITNLDKKRNKIFPTESALSQNYPNPFNPTTIINYELQIKSDVKLIVYDVLGREVKILVNKTQHPGKHSVTFDASNLTSGVYYYKIKTGTNYEQTRKMLLLR